MPGILVDQSFLGTPPSFLLQLEPVIQKYLSNPSNRHPYKEKINKKGKILETDILDT